MEFFILDDNDNLIVNKIDILLVPEFAALWEPSFNRGPNDRQGYQRLKAYRVFKYLKLLIDWESPYKNFSVQDRKNTSIEDCQMTPDELNDPRIIAAQTKYEKMQVTPQLRLLESAYRALDELTLFYNTVDLQERGDDARYIMDSKKIIDSLTNLSKAIAGLESLELVVKKQKEANAPQIRGDVQPGYFD